MLIAGEGFEPFRFTEYEPVEPPFLHSRADKKSGGEGEIWTRIVLFTRQTLLKPLSYFADWKIAVKGLEPLIFGLWDRRFHPVKLHRLEKIGSR